MGTSDGAAPVAQATCVHCVVRAERRPSLDGAPAGQDGERPLRLLDAGDGVWLVVSDVALDRYDEPSLEAGLRDLDWVGAQAIAHERIVEHFLDQDALIPLKLFALFLGDASALDGVTARRGALDETFETVRGRREWGVRLLAAPSGSRDAYRTSGAARAPEAPAPGGRPGTDFLRRKQAARRAAGEAHSGAAAAADELFRDLATLADRAHRRPVPPESARSRLLLDAAFLVPTPATRRFHDRLAEARTDGERVGLDLDVTGPWPAYHFIEADR